MTHSCSGPNSTKGPKPLYLVPGRPMYGDQVDLSEELNGGDEAGQCYADGNRVCLVARPGIYIYMYANIEGTAAF